MFEIERKSIHFNMKVIGFTLVSQYSGGSSTNVGYCRRMYLNIQLRNMSFTKSGFSKENLKNQRTFLI